MIKISIITINYNNADGLIKTLDSVFCQNFKNYEYIIIDGGSLDGSKEIIETNRGKFAYWVSEKDSGIYHAMNKGIKYANGEYLLFLNSGDYLYSNDSLNHLIRNNYNEDLIYGDLLLDNGTEKNIKKYPSNLSFEFFIKNSLPHQATLIKKTLFEIVGHYNENLEIISDWVFFLDAICHHNCTYRYVPILISVFDMNGISCDPKNSVQIEQATNQIFAFKYSAFINDYINMDKMKSELNMYKLSRLHRLIHRIKYFYVNS